MLKELNLQQESTMVYQDNIGCVEWASGDTPKYFQKRKHIDIRNQDVMSMVKKEEIIIVPIRSNEMRANFLTNSLGSHDYTSINYKDNFIWTNGGGLTITTDQTEEVKQ